MMKMKMKGKMDSNFDALCHVLLGREAWRIEMRTARLWTIHTFVKPDQINSVEMVLIDDKVSCIHLSDLFVEFVCLCWVYCWVLYTLFYLRFCMLILVRVEKFMSLFASNCCTCFNICWLRERSTRLHIFRLLQALDLIDQPFILIRLSFR